MTDMKGFSIKIIKTIKLMFFLMMLMWLSGFIREYQLYTSHQLIVGKSGYAIDQIDRNKRRNQWSSASCFSCHSK